MTWQQNPAQLVVEPFLLLEYSQFDSEFGQSPSRLCTDTYGAPCGADTLLEDGQSDSVIHVPPTVPPVTYEKHSVVWHGEREKLDLPSADLAETSPPRLQALQCPRDLLG